MKLQFHGSSMFLQMGTSDFATASEGRGNYLSTEHCSHYGSEANLPEPIKTLILNTYTFGLGVPVYTRMGFHPL
eukprot:scaffold15068_cov193-Alexandrium_tamarense.AAC.4